MSKLKFESGSKDDEQHPKSGPADEKGIVDAVDEMLLKALNAGATEIHLEPTTEETRVRMRVAGALEQLQTFPKAQHAKLINRFKILGGMDITRSRIAQRGFFKVKHENRAAECNAYVLPSILGEKVTLEILYKAGLQLSLEHLGFFTEVLKSFKAAINRPNGLVLIVGPPGSGRTTTCYASLAALNTPAKSLATLEMVHKYELPELIQAKPAPQNDFTYEDGVRAMLESNPDVCLIGEIQTPEVARLALQGAFAKRIVLGRMIANDTVAALISLMDMGIEPFLLTAAVNAVISQRLLRRICDHCKEAYTVPEQVMHEIGYKMRPDTQFYRGKGCAACGGTGFRGTLALFELLTLNESLNEMLVARRLPHDIREEAARQGVVSLKRDGVNKVAMGYTSIEEVMNAL